jgi:predicted nucleotidyltransferase
VGPVARPLGVVLALAAMDTSEALPEEVTRVLSAFVAAAEGALGDTLKSIVLYGSAAEGRLRKTSDVNVIVVLDRFEIQRVNRLREPLRTAHAAIELETMFLLEKEIAAAVEAFAVKFADVRHRHRVLYGKNPFAKLAPSRAAETARLKQVLLNLVLRSRQRYLLASLRDEQLAALVSDVAGPLRTCAEALLELRGVPAASPKEALAKIVAAWPGEDWESVLSNVSEARETGQLPPQVGAPTLLRLIDLASKLHAEVEALPAAGRV